MKRKVRLTESDLLEMVKKSINEILNKPLRSWYSERDDNGDKGEPGMVRLHQDIVDAYTFEIAEMAEEEGYSSIVEYVADMYLPEVYKDDCWFWSLPQKCKASEVLFTHGNIVAKDIGDYITFEEYHPSQTPQEAGFGRHVDNKKLEISRKNREKINRNGFFPEELESY